MPSQVGVYNALPIPVRTAVVGGADVSCPSATKTLVITSAALVSALNQSCYARADGVLFIVLGATAPSAMVIGLQIGSGSTVDSITVEPGLLVNSAELMIPISLLTANAASNWAGAGSAVSVTVTPTGQTVTCKLDSSALIGLYPGVA